MLLAYFISSAIDVAGSSARTAPTAAGKLDAAMPFLHPSPIYCDPSGLGIYVVGSSAPMASTAVRLLDAAEQVLHRRRRPTTTHGGADTTFGQTSRKLTQATTSLGSQIFDDRHQIGGTCARLARL